MHGLWLQLLISSQLYLDCVAVGRLCVLYWHLAFAFKESLRTPQILDSLLVQVMFNSNSVYHFPKICM